jgi:hypothetical protein
VASNSNRTDRQTVIHFLLQTWRSLGPRSPVFQFEASSAGRPPVGNTAYCGIRTHRGEESLSVGNDYDTWAARSRWSYQFQKINYLYGIQWRNILDFSRLQVLSMSIEISQHTTKKYGDWYLWKLLHNSDTVLYRMEQNSGHTSNKNAFMILHLIY